MIQYLPYWIAAAFAVPTFWLLPRALRYGFLGVASFGFVAAFEPLTALMMLVIGLLVYGMWLPQAQALSTKIAVRLSIALVAGFLCYFKYLPLLGEAVTDGYDFSAILLPLGISYFSFKLIHYALEMARGTMPEHKFSDYLAWVFLVPIFTAGPIQRLDLFMRERSEDYAHSLVTEGLTRISYGLVKKFIIGAGIAQVLSSISMGGVNALLADIHNVPPPQVIAFLVLTYFYVYMDFSGYTDIAIGTSRLFGLRIMENFNLPFLAPNIGNLWKRWHMSLANWCQSYVYMPMLGWARNPYIAAVASFFVMGMWHAATLNWLAWGMYNALGVCVFQWFAQVARKRKWQFVKGQAMTVMRYPLTFLFFAGSFAFPATDGGAGLMGAFRLLARCFYINI